MKIGENLYQIYGPLDQIYQQQILNFNVQTNQTSQERHELIPPKTRSDKGPEKQNFHTLLIMNIPYNIDDNSIYIIACQFGEIAQYQPFISKGYALITYFDLRISSTAFKNFGKILVNKFSLKVNLPL